MLIGPRLIQFLEPFASVPMTRFTANNTIAAMAIHNRAFITRFKSPINQIKKPNKHSPRSILPI